MPLSDTDILWEATDYVAAANPVVVTHPDAGGTTAGSTVLVFFRFPTPPTVTLPAGFVADLSNVAYRYSNTAGGETSWSFTLSAARDTAWYMVELNGLDLEDPLDATPAFTSGTNANGTTRSTNTSALNAGSNVIAFARFTCTKALSGDVQSWSGYTNGFAERVDFAPAGIAGQQMAVATKLIDGPGTFECTATFATSAGTPPTAGAYLLLYRAADATINAPLNYFTGFEFGTHGGMANPIFNANDPSGPLGSGSVGFSGAALGTWGTGYSVAAGSARSGGFGLKIVGNNSENRAVPIGPISGNSRETVGFDVKMESATGQVVVAYFTTTGATSADLYVWYDVSTTQFGLGWVGGTTVWQTGTTPLDTYPRIDIRMKTDSAAYHAGWWIETGEGDGFQTSPADPTGQTVSIANRFYLGTPATSGTFTAHYDNAVRSRFYAAYPLGPHTVRLLVPETTGGTVSGTSTNFSRFTANGTLATLTVDTVGALLDDVPPTISASSDGVVQTAVAASDYINLPMTTYACAPNEIIAGVRFVAALWGGTGTGTGTLGWRGHDGLTETTFATATLSYDADSLTAASATFPWWQQAMWSGAQSGAWNQTRLDACAIRMGFSTDATPDMGASAVYLEVATREISTSWVVHRLTDDEDPEAVAATVTETLHPYNSGVRTYTVSNDDANRTAEFNYTIGGTPQTPVTVDPGDPPVDVTVGAEAFGEVDSTSFGWQ